MALALVYYVRLSGRMALGMVLVWLAMALALRMVAGTAVLSLWGIYLIIFALAWVK